MQEVAYGDASQDAGDEVRFSAELTRLDRLNDTFSLDIRRLKGNLRSYKFLYDTLREFVIFLPSMCMRFLTFFLVAPIFPPHRFKEWLSVHALASMFCVISTRHPTNAILILIFLSSFQVCFLPPRILHIPNLD